MLPLKKDIRLVRSLHQKKFRKEAGLFIAEGRKVCEEGLAMPGLVHSCYTTDASFAAEHEGVILVNHREMEQLSVLSTAPGYLMVGQEKGLPHRSDAPGEVVLLLDGIADPGNMGTILRTAEWFGIRQVVCSLDCVERTNPKVVQATMGSLFRVAVEQESLTDTIVRLRGEGVTVLGADLGGQDLYSGSWKYPVALVIGSESHGIREEVRALLDQRVTIPGGGKAESLNAAVATAIMVSELYRRSDR